MKNEAYYSDQIGIDDFKDKIFVLTDCTYDKEIGQFILNHRGIIKSAMSRKVEVLIFNSTGTNKHKESLEMKQAGLDIKLISQSNFMKEYDIEPIRSHDSKKTEEEVTLEALLNLYEIQEEDTIIPKIHFKYFTGQDPNTEVINKVFSCLQDKKIINVSEGMIEIVNPDALRSEMAKYR